MVGIAHPGLLDSSRGHVFQTFLLTGCFAHGIDEGTALRQGTVREGEEGLTGGSHCGVDVGEHSAELSAGGRDCCSGHGCWLLRVWSPGEIRLLAVDIRTSDASTIEMVVVARLEQQLERVRGAVKACLCVH